MTEVKKLINGYKDFYKKYFVEKDRKHDIYKDLEDTIQYIMAKKYEHKRALLTH